MNAVKTEVQGRLEQSLHNSVWLTLGLEAQDYRVQRPWSATIAQKSKQPIPLDSGTKIVEVFDRPDLSRQLLILGEPGAGKTTMMLELAEDLVKRALVDNSQPIPVLLSLSSWRDPKLSIFEWMAGELKAKYGLRVELAKQWLMAKRVLPLLDGLDEVATERQRDCAVALNGWLTGDLEQRPCGVLICCRREEFEQVVREPLSLYGAIYLQALTVGQIEDYFARFGLADVWETVRGDEALRELLMTPLFLSMFGLVQVQKTFELSGWKARESSERKIEYLFDTYWEAAMSRRLIVDPEDKRLSKTYGMKAVPSQKQVMRSLVFAARILDREEVGTELLIEKIQPTALMTKQQRWAYRLIIGLIMGLLSGLVIGLVDHLIHSLFPSMTRSSSLLGLILLLVLVSIVSTVFSLIGCLDRIRPIELIEFSIHHIMKRDNFQIVYIKILENLQFSLKFSFRFGLGFGLIYAVACLIYGLINDITTILIVSLFIIPLTSLIISLLLGLMSGLISGLISSLLKTDIQTQIEPNQGIKNSFKNTIFITAIAIAQGIPLSFLLERLIVALNNPYGIRELLVISMTSLVFAVFLEAGSKPFCQHVALRIVLAANRYAPFRYDLLLNYCTERLLLQRIGGRYRFMHKTLQDYFAKMDLD